MAWHPSEHRLVHPLPRAPQFVGRDAELSALRRLWRRRHPRCGRPGRVSAERARPPSRRDSSKSCVGGKLSPRPAGLFVWSFYQEPDAGYFLQELHRYFTPDSSAEPRRRREPALIHLLSSALATGGPHLLVLDGLERVQRGEGHAPGVFGQLEDPLLKGLLTRIAEGIGQTVALVTSRFPLADLNPSLGRRLPAYRRRATDS